METNGPGNRKAKPARPVDLPHRKPSTPTELEEPMEPKTTKPATESRTVQSAIAAFIAAAWAPIVAVLGIILAGIGLDVNADAWLVYSEDGQIEPAEIVLMVKDVVVATLLLLVVKFRKQAVQLIDRWV